MLSVFALHRCGEHSRHPTRSHMELPKLHCYHGWSRFKTLSVCSNDYRTRQHQEWLSISKAGCVWMEPVFGVWNKEISICVIKSPTSPQLSIWAWPYAVMGDFAKQVNGWEIFVCVCVCVCVFPAHQLDISISYHFFDWYVQRCVWWNCLKEIFCCLHNPKRVTDLYGLDNARKYCDMDRSRRLVAPEAV